MTGRSIRISRRAALVGGAALALTLGAPAGALEAAEAESFVQGVIADLQGLIDSNAAGEEGAKRFLDLLERKAAIDQVAKFAAGRAWREMTPAQQQAYQKAFRGYIARTYAKRFGEYSGGEIVIGDSVDAGRKGVLVKSALKRPDSDDIAIEWLVTDRLGPPKIADVVFEGVSLSITLRETFGAMIEKRGGDIDRFIADLDGADSA